MTEAQVKIENGVHKKYRIIAPNGYMTIGVSADNFQRGFERLKQRVNEEW